MHNNPHAIQSKKALKPTLFLPPLDLPTSSDRRSFLTTNQVKNDIQKTAQKNRFLPPLTMTTCPENPSKDFSSQKENARPRTVLPPLKQNKAFYERMVIVPPLDLTSLPIDDYEGFSQQLCCNDQREKASRSCSDIDSAHQSSTDSQIAALQAIVSTQKSHKALCDASSYNPSSVIWPHSPEKRSYNPSPLKAFESPSI